MTKGRSRRARSAHWPDNHLKTAATRSARPSIAPNNSGASGNRAARKAGRSGKIISELTSVSRLTSPSTTTVAGSAARLLARAKSRLLPGFEQLLDFALQQRRRRAESPGSVEDLRAVLDQFHPQQCLRKGRSPGQP